MGDNSDGVCQLPDLPAGIGVPILLAYVYGVVPVSLCRSGGCGVTTSASGVRIEFDEDADLGMSSGTAAGEDDLARSVPTLLLREYDKWDATRCSRSAAPRNALKGGKWSSPWLAA